MPVAQNTQHTKIKLSASSTWSNNFGVINKSQMLANLRTEPAQLVN